MDNAPKTAVVIGAGPAGLTAAYELVSRSSIHPVVLEATDVVGGISQTVEYKGNRIDIGGHRFFSKSDRVMQWWSEMLPIEQTSETDFQITFQNKTQRVQPLRRVDSATTDEVMLVRPRKSRIYYLRKFFDYPLKPNWRTIRNLGPLRIAKILVSYGKSRLLPIRPELTLEQFFINRFGRELYETFFKSYTEKVWGVPCRQLSAEWGAQRIKGLSISKAIVHACRTPFRRKSPQRNVETSLIEQFLYPKFGPGQMWQQCARKIQGAGGTLYQGQRVVGLVTAGHRVTHVAIECSRSKQRTLHACDYLISTMPVRELIEALGEAVPLPIREIARGLVYRDFITVGLLVKQFKVRETPDGCGISDNWIYIQEHDVRVGRLQIFNNWSQSMVADPTNVWLGLEYFCNEGDDLWSQSDDGLAELAKKELVEIGLINPRDVLDSTVVRMPKAYPAYHGSYDRFQEIRQFLDKFENLFLVGRNGMHRYNNQDHSMLSAMTAVDCILEGSCDKSRIWDVNTESEYHEERQSEQPRG